jgi:hypothetical protein
MRGWLGRQSRMAVLYKWRGGGVFPNAGSPVVRGVGFG